MSELGITPDAASVARHYSGLIDGFVLDAADADQARGLDLPTLVVNTLMRTLEDKIALARDCLSFCRELDKESGAPI
jgi:LPPG:FO 2-phospho-L-lactate transferase